MNSYKRVVSLIDSEITEGGIGCIFSGYLEKPINNACCGLWVVNVLGILEWIVCNCLRVKHLAESSLISKLHLLLRPDL